MNITKFSRFIPRALSYTVRRGFGGGAGHHEHTHDHPLKVKEQEITQETLDRFNNIFPGPTKSESTFALHNVIPQVPGVKSKGFIEFLAENFGQAKAESDVEYYIPPKVHENSVFLYQSKELANAVRKFRACEWAGLFFFGALMHQPLFAIPTFAAFYVVYGNALFYELSRRLVTRMDLLPHLEMVQVQKVSAFGAVYSKLIRIDDLEKVDSSIAMEKENMFWGLNKTNVDPYLIFRVISTGEVLCFDRDGYWDYNGISHELIN